MSRRARERQRRPLPTSSTTPAGLELWVTYQQAGDPPHFTWLRREKGTRVSKTNGHGHASAGPRPDRP